MLTYMYDQAKITIKCPTWKGTTSKMELLVIGDRRSYIQIKPNNPIYIHKISTRKVGKIVDHLKKVEKVKKVRSIEAIFFMLSC